MSSSSDSSASFFFLSSTSSSIFLTEVESRRTSSSASFPVSFSRSIISFISFSVLSFSARNRSNSCCCSAACLAASCSRCVIVSRALVLSISSSSFSFPSSSSCSLTDFSSSSIFPFTRLNVACRTLKSWRLLEAVCASFLAAYNSEVRAFFSERCLLLVCSRSSDISLFSPSKRSKSPLSTPVSSSSSLTLLDSPATACSSCLIVISCSDISASALAAAAILSACALLLMWWANAISSLTVLTLRSRIVFSRSRSAILLSFSSIISLIRSWFSASSASPVSVLNT
mmetsp:Transcript_29339/g.94201  ORF Transcript_29339/g.94201 Transcript_29339/m.94201 type:complete len:286 (+) Transcript_29339:408-1265(+)